MLSAFIRLLKTHENPACRSGCIAKISPFIGWRHPWHRHTLLWGYLLQITKLNDKWVVDYLRFQGKTSELKLQYCTQKSRGSLSCSSKKFARLIIIIPYAWTKLLSLGLPFECNLKFRCNSDSLHDSFFYNCTEKIVKFKLCNAELFPFWRDFLCIINFLPEKYFRRILVEILAYWRTFISFLFKFATSSYNGPTLHILM